MINKQLHGRIKIEQQETQYNQDSGTSEGQAVYWISTHISIIRVLCMITNYYYPLKEYECSDSYSKCEDGLQCIRTHDFCDGRADCKDGSDEDVDKCLGNQ